MGQVLCTSRWRLSERSPWQGHASRVKLPGTAKGRPLRTSNRTQPVPGLGRSGRRGKEVSPPNGRRTAGPTSGPLPLPPSAPPPPARTKPSPRRGPRRIRPGAPRLVPQLPAGRELRSKRRSVRSPCAPRSPLSVEGLGEGRSSPTPEVAASEQWAARSPDAYEPGTSGRRRLTQVWVSLRCGPQNQFPHFPEVLPRTCVR